MAEKCKEEEIFVILHAIDLFAWGIMPEIRILRFFVSTSEFQSLFPECLFQAFQFEIFASLNSHVKIPLRLLRISQNLFPSTPLSGALRYPSVLA
jgi:hypothetical protein